MLKTRIMPTLLYKDLGLIKSIKFDSWRRVGAPLQAIKVFNLREVDELIFLDISATNAGREPDFALIDELADYCFMPMTVGGGVRTIEHVRKLLKVGADKVSLNSIVPDNMSLITEIANKFGSQCVVVSIDAKRNGKGGHEAYTHSGKTATGRKPENIARQAEESGAGEILLTSIDNDGTMEGYDLELIKKVSDSISIPLIASGGCGSFEHMLQALATAKASAVAAASIYYYTEQTPLEAKRYLEANGIKVRI
jgi:cyclase